MLRFVAVIMMFVTAGQVYADASSATYESIDKGLIEKLRQPLGGDVDVDFLTRMIAQHDAAIERAKAALAYSSDAKIRMMAGDMLKTLHADQRVMKEWLALYGPKQLAAEPAPLPKALPVAMPVNEKMRAAATVPTSPSSVVTSTVPPTDLISSSVAAAMVSLSEIIPEAMPEVPAHDSEIKNTAPMMEFLDGGQ